MPFPRETRKLGIYIAGLPGFGKTTLLQNIALEDISEGFGACIIDPTGGLISGLIHHLPHERIDDIILFDTNDPLPIDFFSYTNPNERQILTDMLIGIFAFGDNAPRSEPNLMEILGTLFDANANIELDNPARCTFLDILHFIRNKGRREKILEYTPNRRDQWLADPMKPADYFPITKRMIPFFENPSLKTIFGSPRAPINISNVIESGKILLVNLQDTPSAYDIAALISAKFRQATFGRRNIPEEKRKPYYLFIDECHTVLKFAENDFNDLLTRARQFNLCLTLANQFPTDLPKSIQSKLSVFQSSVIFRTKPDNIGPFKSRFPHPIAEQEYPHHRMERLEANRDYAVNRLMDQGREIISEARKTINNPLSYVDRYMKEDPVMTYEAYYHQENKKLGDVCEQKINKINYEIQQVRARFETDKQLIDKEYNDSYEAPVPDLVQIAASLPVGKAIFIPVDGDPYVDNTPDALEKHDPFDRCAEYVRECTKRNYPFQLPPTLHNQVKTPEARNSAEGDQDKYAQADPKGPNVRTDKQARKNSGAAR